MRMFRQYILLLFLLTLLAFSYSQDEALTEDEIEESDDFETQSPFVLVQKQIQDNFIYQYKNVTVMLEVFNSGSSIAYNVDIIDKDLQSEGVELLEGSYTNSIPILSPGDRKSLKYVVKSSTYGPFRFPRAYVRYQSSQEDTKFIESQSTDAVQYIYTYRERILFNLLLIGSYATLGILRTPGEWQVVGISLLVIIVGVVGAFGYRNVRETVSVRNRQKAQKDLFKDGTQSSTQKSRRQQ